MTTEVSAHELGEQGAAYFADAGRFSGRQELGRLWQSHDFASYCGPDKTVLDFGCGDGTILRALPAARRLAVEVSPHCVERIAELNPGLAAPIVVRPSIGEWEEGVADVVISTHPPEHVLSPLEVLRGIRRVLRPGGTFVLVTSFDDWRGKGQREWKAGDRQNHLDTWNPVNIGNLLTEAGFTVMSSRVVSSAWSSKIFWAHRLFGDRAFALACALLSRFLHRRRVPMAAVRPAE